MKLFLKRVVPVTLFMIFTIFVLLSACSKENPAEPKKETPDDDTHVTQNVKLAPSFLALDKLAPVSLWDIRFYIENRSPDLALNSGSAGSAGVSAVNLGVVDFNAEADLSATLSTDKPDTLVIGDKWYNYDFTTHTISSKNEIFLIKSVDYKFYKLRVDSYTNNTWQVSVSPVDDKGKPTDIKTVEITATDSTPGYIALSSASTIEPANWDIAFVTISLYIPEMNASINNPALRINSVEGVEIATLEGKIFDDVTGVPSGLTWAKDEGDNLAVGDAVLNYNGTTHILTPPDVIYIVKTVSGKHYKLKVTSYYDPVTGESGYFNYRSGSLD
ncbi:HmuY family protein [candidate division KSB1 bacterium]|nr:HmuY family protein [candidate division KSB1 bacterium]